MADEFDDEVPELVRGRDLRRVGLRTPEDVNVLVRALRAGKTWEEARALLLPEVQPQAIDGWRDHCLKVAGLHPDQLKPAATPEVKIDTTRSPKRDQKGQANHG